MSRENFEVLLEILDAIDRLDDDDLLVIENLVKALPPDLRMILSPREMPVESTAIQPRPASRPNADHVSQSHRT
jgi:hypothetical protein